MGHRYYTREQDWKPRVKKALRVIRGEKYETTLALFYTVHTLSLQDRVLLLTSCGYPSGTIPVLRKNCIQYSSTAFSVWIIK